MGGRSRAGAVVVVAASAIAIVIVIVIVIAIAGRDSEPSERAAAHRAPIGGDRPCCAAQRARRRRI
jgi:hypothetical protein